ncbi:RNA 2'-phosphotransferase [Steroidobacter flavus]|uniref:Probable RNA 2'-phosphotransferase n=1 Tax=Steroidobacter flavus TaxID=1842136 RepID=A0ABV8T1T7_9GAMM
MSEARLIRISRLMSLILRHKPQQFGILLDAEGYAPLEEVVRAVRESIADAGIEDVQQIVAHIEPDKARFSIEGSDIRANYGHSLRDRIEQPRVVPPEVLLHGTSESAVLDIRREGIRPMRRQYVHLTTHRDLAARVGGRHGKATVLEVEALRASEAGLAFYRANESFWLADFIPGAFIR